MAVPTHSKQTGNSAIHPAAYVGTTDPASPDASVTADDKLWIDKTTGTNFVTGWLLKIRTGGNTAWTTILDLLTALGLKANLASPTFTGTPAAPTAAPGTNTTQLSTTAFVAAALAAITIAASAITSGLLALARGGTNADLSATGPGFLKQATSGAAVTVAAITENDVGAATHDAGNTGTAITIDWSVARVQKVTATGNFTLTHSNMGAGLAYTLEVHTGAGSFTGAFASTNWAGTAPTITVTASKQDTITFYKSIAGTIQGGVFGQSFTP